MNSFQKAQIWLQKLSSEAKFFRKGELPTLEVVNQFLEELGRPDKSFPWRVVVGGTAGKGTICRSVEQTLEKQGLRTACLVSPEVQVITERIRVAGQLISMEEFGETILKIQELAEKLGILPTFYEAIVLAGILAAKKAGTEVLICEVGMGGRLDAVNAVRGKRISVLTFVGADHLEFFDNDIEKLATEKAGVFTKDSVLNLSFEQKYCSILNQQAVLDIEFIKGIKQKLNKKVARKVCEKILGHSAFVMEKVKLPGRWEKLAKNKEQRTRFCQGYGGQASEKNSFLIFDGAHSLDRFEYLLSKLRKISGKKVGIFAMAKNHDPVAFEVVLPEFDQVVWTEVSGERAFWPAKFLQKKFNFGEVEKDPIKAFQKAQELDGKIFVMGSFYLVGQIRELFYSSDAILVQKTEFPIQGKRD